jgi:hypothetical protein
MFVMLGPILGASQVMGTKLEVLYNKPVMKMDIIELLNYLCIEKSVDYNAKACKCYRPLLEANVVLVYHG